MSDAAELVIAPTLTYARRQPHFDYRFSEPRWHIYVDGAPQCRHAPPLDEAAQVCAERPERVCRYCARAVEGADAWPGMGLATAESEDA